MKKLLSICSIFILGILSLNAQTMTFNSGPSETGFTFSGWTGASGAIYMSNLSNSSSVSKNTGT